MFPCSGKCLSRKISHTLQSPSLWPAPLTYRLGALCPLREALPCSHAPLLPFKYTCVTHQLGFCSSPGRLSPAPLPTTLWLTKLVPFQGTPRGGLTSNHWLFYPQAQQSWPYFGLGGSFLPSPMACWLQILSPGAVSGFASFCSLWLKACCSDLPFT